MKDTNCVFCKISSGKIPALVVKQNDRAMALLDVSPLSAGHTLVIPKAHYPKVQEMSREDAVAVFEMAWQVSGAVEAGAQVSATTIAIHNGSEAGQEIPHVHVHIVPRKSSDGAGAIHSMFRNRPRPSAEEMDSMRVKIVASLP
jgi:histidine triad (HIT) family protein